MNHCLESFYVNYLLKINTVFAESIRYCKTKYFHIDIFLQPYVEVPQTEGFTDGETSDLSMWTHPVRSATLRYHYSGSPLHVAVV